MRRILIGSLLAVVALSACDMTAPATPTPVATSTPIPTATRTAIPPTIVPTATMSVPLSVRLQAIDDAETKWNALGISNYRVTFRDDAAFNHYIIVTAEVQNGKAILPYAECRSDLAICPPSQPSEIYTIAGAFQRARQAERDRCCDTVISYDTRYFFPTSIWCYGSSNCADAQRSTSVMLTVLP